MPAHRKTNEEFQKEVYEACGNEYTLLSPYRGSNKRVKIRHNVCGTVYEVIAANFLRGNRCNVCQSKKQGLKYRIDPDEFNRKAQNILGSEYKIVKGYTTYRTRMEVKHLVCGETYKVFPENIIAGHGCPYCAPKKVGQTQAKSPKEFEKEFYKAVDNQYTLLTPYKTKRIKIKVRHNVCGFIYEVYPWSFLYDGARCNKCNSLKNSAGERAVNDFLTKSKIKFENQKTFPWLKNKNSMYYDFYCPDSRVVIEVDGIQHKKAEKHFGGISTFKKVQKRDSLKDSLAKEHGLFMIRLPYITSKDLDKMIKQLSEYVQKKIIY